MIILRKLRTLRLVLGALALPVLISAGFRLAGVGRTQAWLRRWASGGATPGSTPREPQSDILPVLRAQRLVKRTFGIEGTCLERSLTLWALLLRRGLGTELRVGFRRSGGKLEGHAWVEHGGVPLNESREVSASYSVFKGPAAFDATAKPDIWR